MDEIWKDIENFENLYQVSNKGRIRSLDRTIISRRNSRTGKLTDENDPEAIIFERKIDGKIIKSRKNNKGYHHLSLQKDGISKDYFVHRLVAKAFIENTNDLPQVNHIDENKDNNDVNNLEWCDAKYNNNYGSRTERAKKTRQFRGKRIDCE